MRAKWLLWSPPVVAVAVAILTLASTAATFSRPAPAWAAAPPCNSYSSDVAPPENIGVAITYAGGPITDVVYPAFKSYVKDVLPYEWGTGWRSAAYQAGALAVKTFGWFHVNNWRGNSFGGECYNVTDYTDDQVYCAGIGTPGSGASCHGLGTRPSSHALSTAFAVEQTWNVVLQSGGSIYPTYYKGGNSSDACGQWYGAPAPGDDMSAWGSQACAAADKSWAEIVNTYYFPNAGDSRDHTYGNWHGALAWGGPYWSPVSISGSQWKFRSLNSCGGPSTTLTYGNDADIKLVGDWDGNGSHTPGVVRLESGAVKWHLRNALTSGGANISFTFGQYGDIPVVGDWDGNGTWTPGVVRGSQWFLRNANSGNPTPTDKVFWFGEGGDVKVPGKWKTSSSPQPVTAGVVRLESNGAVGWYQSFSNGGGGGRFFTYGMWYDRPIAGDWRTGDGSTHFGPGVVRDDPPDSCTASRPNQGWYLRYANSSGVADLVFRFDFTWP